MISAFEIYFVMQLDTWVFVSRVTSFLSLVIFVVLNIATYEIGGTAKETAKETAKPYWRALLFIFCLSSTIGMLLPTSKTAAAMIILPKIASNENMATLSKEASELYNIAKDAIKKVSKDDKQDSKKEK